MFIKDQYNFARNNHFIEALIEYSDEKGYYVPVGIWRML